MAKCVSHLAKMHRRKLSIRSDAILVIALNIYFFGKGGEERLNKDNLLYLVFPSTVDPNIQRMGFSRDPIFQAVLLYRLILEEIWRAIILTAFNSIRPCNDISTPFPIEFWTIALG